MSLWKIASDVRLMGMGPRAGLGEVALPETQIVGLLLRSEDRPDQQDGDHDDSHHRQAVTPEADQRPTEGGLFAGDGPSGGVDAGHAW